jgi:hypothetical protein
MFFLRSALIIAALALAASASSGDRNPEFQACVSRCDFSICHPSSSQPFSPPLSLWITGWSCMDDCKYDCMHWMTDRDVQNGDHVQQYYGKWPFRRFAGMQEPASVLFSLFNLWFHILGFRQVHNKIPDGHPMKSYYLTWSLISINAWVWSSVFHTRGT